MGFLDNSSNNIILDAVLTDLGREFLARNDGSFSIHKFAFGDDEINYNIIRKYGRAVGREKIEKNTPVFEAITGGMQAQKYKLVTASNPYLIKLPSIEITAGLSSLGYVNLGPQNSSAPRSVLVSLEQQITSDTQIPPDLTDTSFIVEMNNLFLQVVGQRPENVDGQQTATYILTASGENTQNGGILQMTLGLKSFPMSLFSTYGSTLNKSQINTYVKVTGLVSGAVNEFAVVVSQN